jgi:hemolysin III
MADLPHTLTAFSDFLMTLLEAAAQSLPAPPDGGPRYTETDLSHTVAEPVNGLSAAFFLIVVAVFLRRLQGHFREHKFITATLPFLCIGGTGGTLYHLFRVSPVFLVMDWLPILLLCVGASLYFSRLLVRRWWQTVYIFGPAFGLMLISGTLIAQDVIPKYLAINFNYGVMALMVVGPMLGYLYRRSFVYLDRFLLAVGAFALAWVCRLIDGFSYTIPEIGTHWLWHLFGALATYFVIDLVYRLKPQAHPLPPLSSRPRSGSQAAKTQASVRG